MSRLFEALPYRHVLTLPTEPSAVRLCRQTAEQALTEWGISLRHPLPRRATDHKAVLIDAIMALYADMPVVLIGDSGQHDPELYVDIAARHGARVRAIYIRDVTAHDPARVAELDEMKRALAANGAHLVLALDSVAIAEDALRLGLIAPDAVDRVAERVAERAADDAGGRPAAE